MNYSGSISQEDAMEKWIAAVVGDIGGAQELIPAMKILGTERVRWYVDPGTAARAHLALEPANLAFERRGPNESDDPSAIVIGTSATAIEAQIVWTRFGRERGIPVIWVEDWFGTGSRKATHAVSPDLMITIHPIAEGIAREVRANLVTRTCGKPSLSRLSALIEKKHELRREARKALQLSNDEFLVCWFLSAENAVRPRDQIEAFARVENPLVYANAYMMPRVHPKRPDREELFGAIAKLLGDRLVQPGSDSDSAIIASDFVITDWGSTDSLTAILLGIPTAITLFPDDFDDRIAVGFIGGIPPLLTRNGGYYDDWGLTNADQIAERIRYIRSHREIAVFITHARADRFKGMLDPDAAKRIAEVIREYLE